MTDIGQPLAALAREHPLDESLVQAADLMGYEAATPVLAQQPAIPIPGPLDGPLPELPVTQDGQRSRQQLLTAIAQGENLTIRQLYQRIAGGRGHFTAAYPVLLIGGPITSSNAGIHGGIDAKHRATRSVSPTAHRIAALTALGIWPFAAESYNVGDLGAVDEQASVQDIVSSYWGVT